MGGEGEGGGEIGRGKKGGGGGTAAEAKMRSS